MSRRLALCIILLVLASGHAAASTIGPISNFASTYNGRVAWAANASVETNSIVVRAEEIVIGSQLIKLRPDAERSVRVVIDQWSLDSKKLTVYMTSGASTGLNLSWSNPGENLTVWQGGVNTHTCAAVVSPCSWVFSNTTRRELSILTPAGAQALLNASQPSPAPAAAGGSSAPAPAAPAQPRSVAELPHPVDVFPQLSPLQWLVVIICLVLLLNAFPQTQPFVPIFARVPAAPDFLIMAGTTGLVLLWLTPT